MKTNNKKPDKKLVIIIAFALLFLLVFESLMLMLRFERLEKNKPIEWGVSFSQVQAERFGSDWRANYTALLDDLKFKNIRISAYWDRIEPQKNQFDFSETDWMMDEAAKRGAKITLVVGQKNLRYPECYLPDWIDSGNITQTSDEAVNMINQVSERFKNHPALENWQLENEFLLKSFGKCPAKMLTNAQLKKELVALRSVDPNHHIILTQSDQFGIPLLGPFADTFGMSMYRWSWDKRIGYWRYPQNGNYFWWKAGLISAFYGQSIKIHELQAEPWGPWGNEHISVAEASRTMNPDKLRSNIDYAKQTKIKSIDLWGAEWWWYMKQNGHGEMWDSVKGSMASYQAIK